MSVAWHPPVTTKAMLDFTEYGPNFIAVAHSCRALDPRITFLPII
jgi:hypothetical protein